ncbi:hypothetical protein [Profundibacterium mesophilum]|uniref:Uncharacterized protein n=1 Tax=Profundibacterium mesophilum KAUST100406-0324 TaxID=1037889 RepID=A0A921NPH3_9RHOB|nr:hypothetical protein [Profundibacterium mesophilum]KAF0674387.1 hypothetical protein PMES_03312 [Profundibacterium mesophilum KAUST100406-0324]
MAEISQPHGLRALHCVEQMTDAQKIALAIEITNRIDDPRQGPGLLRLGRLATTQGEQMVRTRFEEERE